MAGGAQQLPIHGPDHRPRGPDPIPGTAIYEIKVFEDINQVVVGDGKFIWEIPEDLDGAQLVATEAFVTTVGSGATEIQLRKVGVGDLLTTKISIDASELNSKDAGSQPAIVANGNEILAWGDHLSIDVDAAGSGAKGLGVILALAARSLAASTLAGAKGDAGGVTEWLGQWATSTVYTIGQAVSNDGIAYVAIADHTSGATSEPGVGANWEDFWMLLVDQLALYSGIDTVIDGQGYVLDPGIKAYIAIPFDCEISEGTLLADAAGSVVVDLWRDTYGNHPPVEADSITASAPLTLSSAIKTTDTTLTGWSKTLTAGDVLAVVVESVSGIRLLTVGLRLRRTGGSGGVGATDAVDVFISDAGNYFTGGNVEAALQELGAAVGGGGGAPDPIFEIFGNPDTEFEFDTSSFTGLTALGTPDSEDADTTIPGHYFVGDNDNTTVGRYASAPSAPFTIIGKVGASTVHPTNNGVGVFIGEGTPGVLEFCGLFNSPTGGNGTRNVAFVRYSDPSTYGGASGALDGQLSPQGPFWVAIRVNSSTSVDYLYSMDGYLWYAITLARNPSITIGSAGVFITTADSARVAGAFDFLRIWNSALTFPGL